jgi:GNAT superfamily N-acetyltransferase
MSASLTIRPIRDADWPAIDRIQRACFAATAIEPQDVLQSISRHSPVSCLLAETDRPLAYVLAHPWTPDDVPPLQAVLPGLPVNATSLFFHDLAVTPEARGTGLAHRLVEELLAWAGRQGLLHGSLISVQDSRRFWERYGFEARPDLTARFQDTVARHYQVEFVFMTARWEF